MKECIITYLKGRGYNVNATALSIIQICDDWYSNREIKDFHVRKNMNNEEIHLARLNMAKRSCADDANLCEVISIAPEKESQSQQFIDELLSDNRFDVRYREQLEKTTATGTVGAYIYLRNADYYEIGGVTQVKNGDIRINYCDADCIIPLTVDNKLVTECAFGVTNVVKGKEKSTLVIFTRSDSGQYTAETVIFDENGNEIREEGSVLTLSDVKPFAIMTTAEVNNIDHMEGYGLPKVYGSIPLFMGVDLCWNILFGDMDKADKLLFVNELLTEIQRDKDGRPYLTPQQKKLFMLLGEKLPDQKDLIYEYNPTIRIREITDTFELVLSLISMKFGYGTKKYKFEDGQITTATEYIGEKQDELQELNRQRKQAKDYIADIIRAAMWFSNTFKGTNYDTNEPLSIEFDDSYIEDRGSSLEAMRNDALSFPEIPWLTFNYIKERYNLSDEEAAAYIKEGKTSVDEEPEGVE